MDRIMGKLPIIDMDIHPSPHEDSPLEPHLPDSLREALKQRMGGAPGTGYGNPFGVWRRDAVCHTARQTAEDHLDKLGIAYAVIQPPGMSVSLVNQIDVGSALAKAWNDWQIHDWLDKDSRYVGSICVNMRDPEAAVREIDRCAEHLQMRQLCICGESDDLYGHRRYWPIYAAASRHGLPITVHPGNEGSLRSATTVGRPSSYFEWHTVIPTTYQAHLVSLVAEGVFEKFSNLRFVLCEGGISWLPHTVWRMEKNFKALRAAVPWLKRLPHEYVFEHVRVTTQPIEEPLKPEHIHQIMDMIQAERTLLFATDFPHWDFDDPIQSLPRGLSDTLKPRLFYENAAELLGLPSLAARQASMTSTKQASSPDESQDDPSRDRSRAEQGLAARVVTEIE